MNIGMLWFDNDKSQPIDAKVQRAADYYLKKYGKSPDLCFIHPATGPEGQVDGITVKHSGSQQPNYFWIGVYQVPVSVDDWKMRGRDAWRTEMDREEQTP